MVEPTPTSGSDSLDNPPTGSKRLVSRREALRLGLIGGAAAMAAPAILASPSFASSPATRRVPQAATTTIKFWTWYIQQQTLFPQLAKQFEALHPNVSVQVRTFGTLDAFYPALEAAVSAGEAPDIFGPGDLAITYGQDGVALDLRAALGEAFVSGFFDSTNLEYSLGSKQFGLGWMAQTFGVYYNPTLLKKAKVDVPETWDDLISAAPAILKLGLIPLGLAASPSDTAADVFLPLVTQASNDPTLMLKLDTLTQPGISWNSPPVVSAFGMLQKLRAGRGLCAERCGHELHTGRDPLLHREDPPALWGLVDAARLPQRGACLLNKLYGVAQTPAWAPGAKHWCGNQAGAGLSVSAKSSQC